MAAQMSSGELSWKGELAKLQATEQEPVAIMYQAIATGNEVSAELLEVGSRELGVLNRMRGSVGIWPDGVLEACVGPQNHARSCAVCPPAILETVVWADTRPGPL